MLRGMRLAGLLLALFVTAATACGTTTSATDTSLRSTGAQADGGLGSAGGVVEQDSSGGRIAGGRTAVREAQGGDAALPGSPGSFTPSGRAVSKAFGPGITATSVRIGAFYIENQAAANAALGAGGVGGGDARNAYNAMIGEINRTGGLGGRRIVPVYYGVDATSSTPIDQQLQQACARFTQDTSVFAILPLPNEIMLRCAKRHGAFSLASGLASPFVPKTFRDYPNYVETGTVNLVRLSSVTVEGLHKQSYFAKGNRIGVVAWDYPNYHEAVERGIRPALKALGHDFATQPAYITPPQTLNEAGGMTAALSNAVLRFSTEGINRVMLLDGPAGLCGVGCITAFFMRAAQSQRYYPRYGLNDNNGPVALYQAGLLPADQLRGSLAVGWMDHDKTYDVGWRVNPARERCYDFMRRKGVSMGDANQQQNARAACDELWFLQAAVNRPEGVLSVAGVMSWVNARRYGYNSTQTYETHFSTRQHDGVAAARRYRFDDACECFRYTSKPYRLPTQ